MKENREALRIEVCLESVESVVAAQESGAYRVELCTDLFEGGLTPSLGMFRRARKVAPSIKISVMIRPRGGDFCYSEEEFATMLEDVKIYREEGADAVVFGILSPDGTIDEERSARLIGAARPLEVTFHRAFDMTHDASSSLETLIDLGVDRVLTSGLEPTVLEGMHTLASLVRQAGERIIVMPGCGITTRNFDYLHENIKAREYHVLIAKEQQSRMQWRPGHIYMGGLLRQPEFSLLTTDGQAVRSLVSGK